MTSNNFLDFLNEYSKETNVPFVVDNNQRSGFEYRIRKILEDTLEGKKRRAEYISYMFYQKCEGERATSLNRKIKLTKKELFDEFVVNFKAFDKFVKYLCDGNDYFYVWRQLPEIECLEGGTEWWLNGKKLTREELEDKKDKEGDDYLKDVIKKDGSTFCSVYYRLAVVPYNIKHIKMDILLSGKVM